MQALNSLLLLLAGAAFGFGWTWLFRVPIERKHKALCVLFVTGGLAAVILCSDAMFVIGLVLGIATVPDLATEQSV